MERSTGQLDFVLKAKAHGIAGEKVDGMDVLTVMRCAKRAIDRMRETGEPYFLEMDCQRFVGHGIGDDNTKAWTTYRTQSQIDEARKRDPLVLLYNTLSERGLLTRRRGRAAGQRGSRRNRRGDRLRRIQPGAAAGQPVRERILLIHTELIIMATMRYQQALRLAMTEEMERDPNVFLCGEEVGQYQGTYRVTEGMLDKFGPRRVVDTPISEIGIAGMATGSAMVGLRPIAEFMTWSFALEAMDQLVNHAAKITYMSGGRIQCPVVFRGPAGVGTQLSAQHSQSMESWYAHTPGFKVAMPATACRRQRPSEDCHPR